jgi:type I restriction enzyme S subunit
MSRIEVLIQQLCPQGVEIFSLGELGVFENIGVDKKTNAGEKKVMLLNFMDVMRNKHIHKNILSMEVSASDSKIEKCDIKQHDLFITPTSETRDEIGFAAVAIEDISDSVYSYHVMRYRLNNKNAVTPYFIRYLFESDDLRIQIYRASKGLTRYGLSAKDFAKLTIPFPPLDIQEEIVKTLDLFTKLEAELEAELEARKTQYTYYRDALLSFEGKEVEWKTLGDVGEFIRGNGLQKSDFTESGIGCIHYGQIYTYYGTFTDKTKSFVSPELANKLKKAKKGDLIITNTSENVEDVCKTVAWLGDEEIVTGGHATIFKHKQNPKYLAYYTQTQMFFIEKKKYAQGAKVTDVSAKNLAKIIVPIPSLKEQERIVAILDKLDALVNNITIGLPAEIQARRKQYEYYRNRLLTFKELANG